VALETIFPGDFSISYDSIAVAFVTGEAIIENERVVESRLFIVDKSVFGMAVGTLINLGIVFTLFKVTDETGTFSDRYVFSLDDLRVAARTLKEFSPLKIFKMDFMVEGHFLKLDRTFEQSFIMTAFC
jgi:hypothetical protein